MIGLVVSGVTAFPLPYEVGLLGPWIGQDSGWLSHWIGTVHAGLVTTGARYPFLFYGTDWLAFAHLVIAILFVGPIKDPVRNVWVILWGLIACALVIPLALVCGSIRGIPLGWQLIDCSFGVVGFFPLWVCLRAVKELEEIGHGSSS
jgi:hypothetical protein